MKATSALTDEEERNTYKTALRSRGDPVGEAIDLTEQIVYKKGLAVGRIQERKRIADIIEKGTLECKHCLGLVKELRRD